MADEAHVQRVDEARRDRVLEKGLSLHGGRSLADETKAHGDPMDVRVDREVGTVEGEKEHAGRRLRSDAGKGDEDVPQLVVIDLRQRPGIVEVDAVAAQRAERGAEARSLREGEAAPPDGARNATRGRAGDGAPGRIGAAQVGVGAVAIHVAGVLRQDREDQLVERWQVPRRRWIAVLADELF